MLPMHSQTSYFPTSLPLFHRRAYNRLFYRIHNLPAFSSHFERCMNQSKGLFLLQLLNQPAEFAVFDSESRLSLLVAAVRVFIFVPSGSMAARTVIAAFYGIDVKTHNDPYIALVEGPLEELVKTLAGTPGLVVRLSLSRCRISIFFSLCPPSC
jgi:hypothetical protein